MRLRGRPCGSSTCSIAPTRERSMPVHCERGTPPPFHRIPDSHMDRATTSRRTRCINAAKSLPDAGYICPGDAYTDRMDGMTHRTSFRLIAVTGACLVALAWLATSAAPQTAVITQQLLDEFGNPRLIANSSPD